MTAAMWIATLNFLALCLGLVFRKKRSFHVPLMLAGILSDLTLVLVLQFQRQAIQTALSLTLEPLQQAHVFTSSVATLLYIPTLALGFKLLRKPSPALKKTHKQIALVAFFFRVLGFVLMFSMIGLHSRT